MAEAESTTEDISGFVVATAGLLNFRCWYDKSDSTLYLTKGEGHKIHRMHMDSDGVKRMRDEDWINVLRAIKQGIDREGRAAKVTSFLRTVGSLMQVTLTYDITGEQLRIGSLNGQRGAAVSMSFLEFYKMSDEDWAALIAKHMPKEKT